MSIYDQTSYPVREDLARAHASQLEDLGDAGDLTSTAVIPDDALSAVELVARTEGCIAGLDVAASAFQFLEAGIEIEKKVQDGTRVSGGQLLALVNGPARA